MSTSSLTSPADHALEDPSEAPAVEALSMVMRSENALMGMSMMVLFPLTFVSNVFVDLSTMPGWLQAFVEVNPVTMLVTATRGLMHGAPVGGDVAIVLAVSAALVAVFGPVTMLLYRRKS